MSAQDELVNQFKEIANIQDTEIARSILESTNWNLEIAIATFLEEEQEIEDTEIIPDPEIQQSFGEAEEEETNSPIKMSSDPSGSKKKSSGAKPKFATLGTLNNAESSSDEEQGQAFYAGGSERSGQQVLGPPRKNPIKDYVSEVFKSAQQSGAAVDEHAPRTVSSRLYSGTGFRLGQTDNDHEVIPGASSASGAAGGSQRQSELVVLKLWRQGFSINDGDLRSYEDPASKEFMECIMKGEIPQELRKQNMNMIHLDLEDHRHEEFVKPKKRFATFAGEGHTLGSPVPGTVETTPAEPVQLTLRRPTKKMPNVV
uniref:CSON010141 protein n=1 Tax=Culicoides sonorensis TaxID=179676 RepID=A0A336LKN3_CULSO